MPLYQRKENLQGYLGPSLALPFHLGPIPIEDRSRLLLCLLVVGRGCGRRAITHPTLPLYEFLTLLSLPYEYSSTVSLLLFAGAGVPANSLVLGPPSSVTFLTLFLITIRFPSHF